MHDQPEGSIGPFERVYTVNDYWDGPRGGVADFKAAPHFYRSIFSEADDNYTDVFELFPVDDKTLQIALEAWDIWLRWEQAYRERRTTLESHPALPEDRERHTELKAALDTRLAEISKTAPVHAVAEFRHVGKTVEERIATRWSYEVRWMAPTSVPARKSSP